MQDPGAPAPKKKHTGRNILLGVGAVIVLLIIIGALSGGGETADTAKTETKPSTAPATTKQAPATTQATQKATQPAPAKTTHAAPAADPKVLGRGTEVGPFTLQATVKIERDELGQFTTRVSAKNHSDDDELAMFTITVLKGDDILTSLMCIGGGGNKIPAGATTTAQCISTDKYVKGWTKVQIEHTGF